MTTTNNTNKSLTILHELLSQSTSKRLDTLIASFDAGWANGWSFAVDSRFNEALDIKYTPKSVGKKQSFSWTQGSRFNFREGYMIYDTPKAYTIWLEALQHIKTVFQVRKASPSIPATNEPKKWETQPERDEIKRHIASFGQNYVSHTEETNKKGEYTLRVQTKRFAGYLEIAKSVPNETKTGLVVIDIFPISQDNFVKWLITGVDPTTPLAQVGH